MEREKEGTLKAKEFEHQRWFIMYRKDDEVVGSVTGVDKKTKDT